MSDDKKRAQLVRSMLATIGIKAADAREFVELDIWLQNIENGTTALVTDGPLCIWEGCDQQPLYCEGHANELGNPLNLNIDNKDKNE